MGQLSRDDNNTPLTGVVSPATAPYASNPALTGVGTDVLFKWGMAGTTMVNHVFIQNNLASATIYYAFDAVTTQATTPVYALAAGQVIMWHRQCTVLHLQTSAAQTIGGVGGITIEGGF